MHIKTGTFILVVLFEKVLYRFERSEAMENAKERRRVKIDKKNAAFLTTVIHNWETHAVITTKEAEKLRRTVEVVPFNWKRLAVYCFWISVLCLLMAISSVLVDQWLMKVLEKIFHAPASVKSLVLALLAAVSYYSGMHLHIKHPEKVIGSESLSMVGSMFVAGSLVYLGTMLDNGSGHFSLLIFFAVLIYGTLGLAFRSTMLWMLSLLALCIWYGTETGYLSGWGMFFLGMNYPLRYVLFSIVLLGISFVLKQFRRSILFVEPTYGAALFCTFVALWILSIFGNYGNWASWAQVNQFTLMPWSILVGTAALAAIVLGLKHDDSLARGFGITFFILNLYTGYFAFLWNSTHKAFFFSILAISFWLIGTKAEKLWTLKFLHSKEHQE